MVGNPPKPRKRVGANPSPLKRGEDGSGFTNCKKCRKAVPVGAVDVHDCKLEAKIKLSLQCHLPINSADKNLSQSRSRKRKTGQEVNPRTPRRAKKLRGPKAPKKPQTAYFLFMTEFRKRYKKDNADSKGVCYNQNMPLLFVLVNKWGGEKWKSMTEEEKKPYIERAEELRMRYEHALAKYHEELRQFNEEGDSAEVGIIDMDYYESQYEDEDSYEDEYGSESDDD